jgi:PHD/YefM family antitoxin component YafN of YafNO toxin-antitoxin module
VKALNCTESTPLRDVVDAAEHDDVVLLRDGHAVALVVPFDDEDLEWYARERDPAFLASIARARDQVRQGRTRSHEELKKELGIE